MKLTKTNLANSFALTMAFVWLVCTLGVAMFPRPSYMMNKWFMHGLTGLTMGQWNVTFSGFFFGGLVLILFAWFTGYVFGSSLEYFSKK